MRYRFTAIDGKGRVVRGVMAAESEAEAREILIEDEIYPKQLEEASEEKVTWAPKRRIQQKLEDARKAGGTEEKQASPERAIFHTVALFGFENSPVSGKAGLTESGDFIFQATTGESVRLNPDKTEVVNLSGFPLRVLRFTTLDGRIFEFRAGLILTCAEAKEIERTFRR